MMPRLRWWQFRARRERKMMDDAYWSCALTPCYYLGKCAKYGQCAHVKRVREELGLTDR